MNKIDITQVRRGMVCFTFDDSCYVEWLNQIELFKKNHARATFFFNGAINPEMVAAMKNLRSHGHSIGLHTVNHKDAVPHLEEMGSAAYISEQILPQLDFTSAHGVDIDLLAYPNNRHSDVTDRALTGYFRHFRAGLKSSPQAGFWIAGEDEAFLELDRIADTPVLGGVGIGEYYASTLENLDGALTRAAEENKLIVFFSHGISPKAKHVHMPVETLEHCLKKANDLGMLIVGFEELP